MKKERHERNGQPYWCWDISFLKAGELSRILATQLKASVEINGLLGTVKVRLSKAPEWRDDPQIKTCIVVEKQVRGKQSCDYLYMRVNGHDYPHLEMQVTQLNDVVLELIFMLEMYTQNEEDQLDESWIQQYFETLAKVLARGIFLRRQ